MSPEPHNPVEVFYSYAHEDELLRDELKKHLSNLKRQGVITDWYDRDISAGSEWDDEIKQHLDSAKVILLLISPDFMDSDYIHEVEVRRAMERHEAGEACVIPVILRPVDWEGAPFGKLQGLPTDARPVTSWGNQDEAFLSVAKAIRKALQKLSEREFSTVFLPANVPRPPAVGFVARRDSEGRDIVARLKDDLAPDKNKLVALSGPGGVGKSTLAAEAARALSELFGARIVWTSALGRDDYSFATLLDEIATQLGHPEMRALSPSTKTEQVQALIASAPPLIVLDNFESIKDAERVRCEDFLSHRATCPVLITSRQKISSARNITIPNMSLDESNVFLDRLVEQTTSPAIFAQLDRDRVRTASERNPLVMQWIIGQIDLAQDPDTVLDDLSHGEGDAAQRVFDRSFGLEQLGDDGRAALLALALFAPDASRTALAEVAGFGVDSKRLNESVKQLASLYLAKPVAGSRLTVAGLTRELATARLSKEADAGEFRRRFVAHFLTYAEAHAKPRPENFDQLEVEKGNAFASMELAFDLSDWQSVMELMDALSFDGVNGFLPMRGYWEEAIRHGKQALKAARSLSNEPEVASFSYNLAMTYHNRGDLKEARQLYDQTLEIEAKLGNQIGIARPLHQLGMLAHHQGNLKEARRLYNESLEISKKLEHQVGIASTLHQLAMLAQIQGELEEARQLYNQSLGIQKDLGNQSGIAVTLHQLAMLAQVQGEFGEARQRYNQSLEIHKALGNQHGISSTLNELATLAMAQGELEGARQLYNQSLGIAKKLGDQSGIATTLHQLAILSAKTGNTDDAVRLFREALTIFEKLGSPDADTARQNLARVEGKSS